MSAFQPIQRGVPFGLMAIVLVLDVAVRVVEKIAVLRAAAPASAAFVVSLLRQPWWWLGLALAPLQLFVWMRVLARTELSVAYPLSSLGYPLTMLAAAVLFGERLDWRVWLGAGLMTIGAALLAPIPSASRGVRPPGLIARSACRS